MGDPRRFLSPTVQWLYDLRHFGMKLGLENIRALLAYLGRPDHALPIVQVAGTNGKGSVAAMLEATLAACGYRTGLFTSPHLVHPRERIRIGGRDLSEAELDAALATMRNAVERAIEDGALETPPSFFEVMTATALDTFRVREVDVGVLEVGLGGRLDATTAADADVVAIVSIGLDHTKTLGGTIESIAAEKGGAIRPGKPVVVGGLDDVARAVLHRIADERGATWVDTTETTTLRDLDDDGFDVESVSPDGRSHTYRGLRSSLAGDHQRGNARVAIATLERIVPCIGPPKHAAGTLDGNVPSVAPGLEAAVREGLARARWRGRLEWLAGSPPILVDAAHNPDGIATLAAFLADRERSEAPRGPKPTLVFASTREKDLERVLAPLAPFVRGLVATRSSIDRAMDPAAIAVFGSRREGPRPRFDPVRLVPDPGDAVEEARRIAGPGGVVLVAGSVYLVGNVLAAIEGDAGPGPVDL